MRDTASKFVKSDTGKGAAPANDSGTGLLHALGCYLIWGLLPVYFHILQAIGPFEILAHRVLWSLVLIVVILGLRRELRQLVAIGPRTFAALAASALCIGTNWLVYIWAVSTDHIVAGSLGYFLNPLVNVLLGVTFLHERLPMVRWGATALAGAGVAILAAGAPDMLWVSLTLAVSFGLYGLIRKLTPISPLAGLGIETMILTPPAIAVLAWLAWHGGFDFGRQAGPSLMLVGCGIVTSVPLLLFASAARKLPLVTLGLVQYVGPTIQFLLGVLLFGETLSTPQWAAFALIWSGLAIFALHMTRTRAAIPPPE